ncbi:MAG: hypothetical protein JRN19_06515 [Nitrososphaerota archaeon]|jgi:hypothetical protein|nr:hypothetical protein [Nitrososphaerota archaeon]MDG7039115.1 hypothetical protein [Nitrososphaerota archaeon]MDG7042658.1 hypothetical protein [Nitrososphaerota archaeon]MDG7044859.1 hypothetical protein [Nitrososphaerota archaeon]MDG7049552.1 hypothetical protein [Nitrososphaerota archaeon]
MAPSGRGNGGLILVGIFVALIGATLFVLGVLPALFLDGSPSTTEVIIGILLMLGGFALIGIKGTN